jgi:hypothetical protein
MFNAGGAAPRFGAAVHTAATVPKQALASIPASSFSSRFVNQAQQNSACVAIHRDQRLFLRACFLQHNVRFRPRMTAHVSEIIQRKCSAGENAPAPNDRMRPRRVKWQRPLSVTVKFRPSPAQVHFVRAASKAARPAQGSACQSVQRCATNPDQLTALC